MDVKITEVQNMYAAFLLNKKDISDTVRPIPDASELEKMAEESRLMTETVRPVSSIYSIPKTPNRDNLPDYIGKNIDVYK